MSAAILDALPAAFAIAISAAPILVIVLARLPSHRNG
jgi:hypothetical protein